jgi:hypothetical protein
VGDQPTPTNLISQNYLLIWIYIGREIVGMEICGGPKLNLIWE